MSEEEIIGMLRLMQERIATVLDVLARMESRQMQVQNEIKAELEQRAPDQ